MRAFARTFFQLRLRDMRLVVLAWLLNVFIRAGLTLTSYKFLDPLLPAKPDGPAAPEAFLRRVRFTVFYSGKAVPRCTCLVRALTARTLLAMKGHSSTLHVGVAKNPGAQMEAHAWLTTGDSVVTGEEGYDLADYAILPVGPS